jgi:hypothetical protein
MYALGPGNPRPRGISGMGYFGSVCPVSFSRSAEGPGSGTSRMVCQWQINYDYGMTMQTDRVYGVGTSDPSACTMVYFDVTSLV